MDIEAISRIILGPFVVDFLANFFSLLNCLPGAATQL